MKRYVKARNLSIFIGKIIPEWLLPYIKLLLAMLFIGIVYMGPLSTMPIMDVTVKYLMDSNVISYDQAVKWGKIYIFLFPLTVYTAIFFALKKNILENKDYYKKIFDCITCLGLFILFGNQYWEIDNLKIFFGNVGFMGLPLTALWFRLLIILNELVNPQNT